MSADNTMEIGSGVWKLNIGATTVYVWSNQTGNTTVEYWASNVDGFLPVTSSYTATLLSTTQPPNKPAFVTWVCNQYGTPPSSIYIYKLDSSWVSQGSETCPDCDDATK